VSIVIPTAGARRWLRGHGVTLVVNCLRSLLSRTRYDNFEIVVVVDPRTPRAVRRELAAFESDRVRFVDASGPFNFSSRINLGVRHARGEHLVLLNDDTEVRRPDWLEAMLEVSQDRRFGVVGAKLVFHNGRVESCGVAIALPDADRLPYTPFWGYPGDHPGHAASLIVNREFEAVTGACQMVRADVFEEVGGYDEAFTVDFGDVDFCLRVRQHGYQVVTCPRALITHYEAASRPTGGTSKEAYQARWMKAEDRYWNPLAVLAQDYSLSVATPRVVVGPQPHEPVAAP
jgi:GT2 family glycosyltransferase